MHDENPERTREQLLHEIADLKARLTWEGLADKTASEMIDWLVKSRYAAEHLPQPLVSRLLHETERDGRLEGMSVEIRITNTKNEPAVNRGAGKLSREAANQLADEISEIMEPKPRATAKHESNGHTNGKPARAVEPEPQQEKTFADYRFGGARNGSR